MTSGPTEWVATHLERLGEADGWDCIVCADHDATLAKPAPTLYRRALAARRAYAGTAGDTVRLLDAPADVLGFERGGLRVYLNCGDHAVPLPEGEPLIASGPLDDGRLPADTAVWLGASGR